VQIFPDDWVAIRRGQKTEYRTPYLLTYLTPPQLAVGYRTLPGGQDADTMLLLIESAWREPVGAVSPESLEREGFPNLDHFRRYWMRRTGERFKPLSDVQVMRVRPFEDGDVPTIGLQLIRNLYGPWLSDGFGLRQ
jgi:hypothetical protein